MIYILILIGITIITLLVLNNDLENLIKSKKKLIEIQDNEIKRLSKLVDDTMIENLNIIIDAPVSHDLRQRCYELINTINERRTN